MNRRSRRTKSGAYVYRWFTVMSVVLMVGGVFAFGFLAWLENAVEGTLADYNPVWMIGMLPLMAFVATPINLFINRQIHRHLDTLTESMNAVANGRSGVYIPTAAASAFTDVYENFNKMAGEIEGAQRLRTEMVDNFSHELKTPIASINGFARLLQSEELGEERRREYLAIIVKESDRLAVLARETLLLSKLEAQEIVPDPQPYNLGRQIQNIAIQLESDWAGKDIELSAELPDAQFVGNANLMESVWTNLLTNAIKFTPRCGEIAVRLRDEGDRLVVTVADTGIGMSEEVQKRVFERYYQGDASHTAEGHGLGLSIVRRIVRLCGGTIAVESKEGEGSTFIVTLPKGRDLR